MHDAKDKGNQPAVTGQARRDQLVKRIVVGVVIAAIVLAGAEFIIHPFFSSSPPPASSGGPAITASSSPNLAKVRVNGVELALHIAVNGPYFLSELLPVDVTLTNYTGPSLTLNGLPVPSPCGSALWVMTTGGGAPHYTLPNAQTHSCPARMGGLILPTGRSLTIHFLLALADSGRITLTGQTSFMVVTPQPGGGQSISFTDGPFAGHWPSLHINVGSQVPANRKVLSLRVAEPNILVTAPSALRSQLVYIWNISCNEGGGTMITGNYRWEALKTEKINDQWCSGTNRLWTVSVGAPGYAIVSLSNGKQPPAY
jgi:hypothetical protein